MTLEAAARAARALEGPSRPVLRALDAAAAFLAGRRIPIAAVAAVAIPILRIVAGDAAAFPAVLLFATTAGTAVLLRVATALHEGPERDWVSRALLAGLLLRVVLAAAIATTGGFPDERQQYDPVARAAAAEGPWGSSDAIGRSLLVEGRWAWYSALAKSYLLLGPFPESGRLLGVLLGLGSALLAGEVARPPGGRRAAALAVVVLALHPEAALWSGAITRDGLSAFLVLAGLAAAVRVPGGLLRGRLLLAAGPLALLAMNSFPAATALGAALAGAVLLEGSRASMEGRRGAVRVALAGLLVLLAAGAAVQVVGPWLDPVRLPYLRDGALSPGRTWAEELARLPGGLAFALLAPWPWDAVTGTRLAYEVLALGGLAVTAVGIVGLTTSARRAAAPALFALAFLGVLALTEGNAGTLARHRLPLAAILSVGAGVLAAAYFSGGGARVSRTEPSFPE